MEKLKEPKVSPIATGGFKHWAVAFIVCNFNVDIGPEIEILYPPDVPFTTADLSAICFNSFPEQQNTETAEDLSYDFAITNNSPDIKLSSPNAPHGSADTFYGSCIFRQEFDDTMKRSFNQRTLVLISHHNFTSFHHRILQKMTESGHLSDPTTIESAHSQMNTWEPPALGRHHLPFMGTTLTLDIAPHRAFPLQGLPGPTPLISDIPLSIYAYEPIGSWDNIMHYMPCITDLYVLYEKLILCERHCHRKVTATGERSRLVAGRSHLPRAIRRCGQTLHYHASQLQKHRHRRWNPNLICHRHHQPFPVETHRRSSRSQPQSPATHPLSPEL